jgi:hypothetical protein
MEIITKPLKPSKKEGVHYVNNREFSQNVVDYVDSVKKAKERGTEVPRITEYIGRCFLRIAEGLSHKPNFAHYTYREEMVMDGVENCIKAIMNYNIEAATRTGSPNAFAYFTQINYYAFIRRIMKEKKQQDIKFRYTEHSGIHNFMSESLDGSEFTYGMETGFIDILKNRIDKVKTADKAVKQFKKKVKTELELFMSEV